MEITKEQKLLELQLVLLRLEQYPEAEPETTLIELVDQIDETLKGLELHQEAQILEDGVWGGFATKPPTEMVDMIVRSIYSRVEKGEI